LVFEKNIQIKIEMSATTEEIGSLEWIQANYAFVRWRADIIISSPVSADSRREHRKHREERIKRIELESRITDEQLVVFIRNIREVCKKIARNYKTYIESLSADQLMTPNLSKIILNELKSIGSRNTVRLTADSLSITEGMYTVTERICAYQRKLADDISDRLDVAWLHDTDDRESVEKQFLYIHCVTDVIESICI
jgi:hypothetical protein